MAKVAKEHAAAFPNQPLPEMGFPDAGSGRFSMQLSYADWFTFNNAMRSHLNIVEQLPFISVFLLTSGLIIPNIVLYVAWAGALARLAYVIGYAIYGPNARVAGALA